VFDSRAWRLTPNVGNICHSSLPSPFGLIGTHDDIAKDASS